MKCVLAAVVLTSLLVLMPSGVHASSPPDLSSYRRAVHSIRLRLDALARRATAPAASRRELAAELSRLASVRLPDGRVVATNLPDFAGDVALHSAVSLVASARELDALDGALAGAQSVAAGGADLASLDTILRDSRFHPQENLIQRFFDWLGAQVDHLRDALARLLQRLLPGGPTASVPTFVFALIFLVMVAVSALLVVRAALSRAVPSGASLNPESEPRTVVAARDRVEEHLAAGDFRLALRYLLLSTLLQLQERGLLRLRPGMTNREYLRALPLDLAGDAGLTAPMAELIDLFDRVWYGHEHIDRAGYERGRDLAAEALGAAERVDAA